MSIRALFTLVLGALVASMILLPQSADAQIWKKVKKKAKETVERKAEEKTEDAVEGTIDGIENAVRCSVGDDVCVEKAKKDGKTVVMTDASGEVIRDESGDPVTDPEKAKQAQAPGEGVWANYDFVPGDRVLFADDFSDEYVGDFPRRLRYVKGNVQVVEWQGQRFIKGTGGDRFIIDVPEGLPDQWTLEFNIHDPATEGGTVIIPAIVEDSYPGYTEGMHFLNIGHWRGSGVWESGGDLVSTNAIEDIEETVVPIRVAYDRGYVKVYARESRIANMPQFKVPDEQNGLTFALSSRDDRPIYLGDIRLAEGGRTRIYETLSAEGRVVTRGILFDTGSATIRPESTPTLQDIGRTLQKHGTLRLRIEGHTDNVGSADGNQTLSQKRADAVRAFLMSNYDVAADRLEAAGMGQTVPAASNDTPEGRQTNRRVELVKL